jgi:hypothetical protein
MPARPAETGPAIANSTVDRLVAPHSSTPPATPMAAQVSR